MARAVDRLAAEIIERAAGAGRLVLIGIHRRGVPLSQRIAASIRERGGPEVFLGTIDITQYRDDLTMMKMVPELVGSDIPFDLDDMHVILCDEVIYTGRSVRAALDELLDHGRPAIVQLAVLVDREGRHFPIQPEYAALKINIPPTERVSVRFQEVDGNDAVFVQSSSTPK